MRGLISRNHEIYQIYATKGQMGTPWVEFRGERLGKIREREARKAAKVLGIDQSHVSFLGFSDRNIEGKRNSSPIRKVRENIEKIRPRIIFAPEGMQNYSWYKHPDHINVGKSVYEACRRSSIKPILFYYHSLKSNTFIEVTKTQLNDTRKVHLSQWHMIPWTIAKKIPLPGFRLSMNLADLIQFFYFFRCGFRWIEPFRRVLYHLET